MHLMALGAFRQAEYEDFGPWEIRSLNAPYGARCFPTSELRSKTVEQVKGLNAPYGARCFPTVRYMDLSESVVQSVLMHLMALGAF